MQSLEQAHQEGQRIAKLCSAERWYRSVGLVVSSKEIVIEVRVDPMCNKLAKTKLAGLSSEFRLRVTSLCDK